MSFFRYRDTALTTLSDDDLAAEYIHAKAFEADATEYRRLIGTALQARVEEPVNGEGTVNFNTPTAKVAVSFGVTRKIDSLEAAETLRRLIPSPIFNRLVRFKPELNVPELRYLQLNEPDYYATVCEHVTTKPTAPQVKAELIAH